MPAYDDGTTPTLVTEKPPAIAYKVRCGSETYIKPDGSIGTAGKGGLMSEELSFTIAATQDQTLFQPIAIQGDGGRSSGGQNGCGVQDDGSMYTLNTVDRHSVMKPSDGYIVRRLTPRECERLQGMPDDHTMVPYRGKPAEECPDGPRYKAIGNSMAVPCMAWLGRRLQMVDNLDKGLEEE